MLIQSAAGRGRSLLVLGGGLTVRGVGARGLGCAAVGAKATGGLPVDGRLEGSWAAELAASQFGSETVETD